MYFGNRHTAVLEATVFRPFTCPHCSYETIAKIRTKGEGQGVSPYMLREEGAKEAASTEARQKAEENAGLLLSLAICPRCDKRDEAALSSVKSAAYGKAFLFSALVAGICWLLSGRHDPGILIVAGGVVAAITAIATIVGDSWKWNEVEHRVELMRHSEVEALLAKLENRKAA